MPSPAIEDGLNHFTFDFTHDEMSGESCSRECDYECDLKQLLLHCERQLLKLKVITAGIIILQIYHLGVNMLNKFAKQKVNKLFIIHITDQLKYSG